MSTVELFKVPIVIKELPNKDEIGKEINQFMKKTVFLQTQGNIGNGSKFGVDMENATEDKIPYNYKIFTNDSFSLLPWIFQNEFKDYIHRYCLYEHDMERIDAEENLELDSWIVKQNSNESGLITHQHPDYLVNGVYYHKAPDPGLNLGGEFIVYSPFPQLSYFNFSSQDRMFVRPCSGLLIIFPSFLNHAVNPIRHDPKYKNVERVNISASVHLNSFLQYKKVLDK